jgi:hypothetical protein
MKKSLILAALCIFLGMSIPAAAQTVTAAPASGHESHAGHDAAKPSAAPDAVQPTAHDHSAGRNVQMMDGHMEKMKAQMEKIRATANPAERRKLMQEHMADMQEGMKMMQGIPGCKMMAVGMKHGDTGKMDMEQMGMGRMMMCHQMMEKKMEMMQEIMEGLIEAGRMKK